MLHGNNLSGSTNLRQKLSFWVGPYHCTVPQLYQQHVHLQTLVLLVNHSSQVPPGAAVPLLWLRLEERGEQPPIRLFVKAAHKLILLRALAQVHALVHLL